MHQQLDWLLLFRAPYGERVLEAVLTTLELSLTSWVFALVIGILAGLLREAPVRAVHLVATAFVEIFRNVPLLENCSSSISCCRAPCRCRCARSCLASAGSSSALSSRFRSTPGRRSRSTCAPASMPWASGSGTLPCPRG